MNKEDIIQKIHASPWKGVIASTGCAPGLANALLAPGGGSATVLEAIVPYAYKSLEELIGHQPDKACSEAVALEMASAAFSRADELRDFHDKPFGLGITATLRKNGPERKGRIHQVFLSYQTAELCYSHSVQFDSELSREIEEELVTLISLDVLALHILSEKISFHQSILSSGKVADGDWFIKEATERQQYPNSLKLLLTGNSGVWKPEGDETDLTNQIVIPGSFNPFHDGHGQMAMAAYKKFGRTPLFELSVTNVDKGRLSGYEALKRIRKLPQRPCSLDVGVEITLPNHFVVTDAPTFLEKSRIFQNSIFIVGIDTWYRLIDPKYYNHDKQQRDDTLAAIQEMGCSFLVLGRFIRGSYHTLPESGPNAEAHEGIPEGLASGLPESEFRVDISSTQLRKQNV